MTGGSGFFVTGTDTGVGKTVGTAAIGYALSRAGHRVAICKPVQTGVLPGGTGDAEFVLAAVGPTQSADDACVYRFREPASPLVAARAEGVRLDPEYLRARVAALRTDHDVILVEGAGGLLVPLTSDHLMADLALLLGLPLVVVARPGLGTINHTLLTLEAARARGLRVAGIVLAGWRTSHDLATRTNPAQLVSLGHAPLLGVLPWDPGLSVEEMRVGDLRGWAQRAVAPSFGGTFDADRFLADLGAA